MKEALFWTMVDKSGDCWLWLGGKSQGYGYINLGYQKLRRAHRLAWELTNGPIPNGMCVLHKCDVRNCVRPEHLFLGTRVENVKDCMNKDRVRRGENHRASKLTEDQVKEIRRLYGEGRLQKELARLFRVHIMTISDVVRGKQWKRLTGLSS